jgi:hypothetical protein
MEQRIYIVESHGGQYEDSWDHVEGVFLDKNKAIQCAKDICDDYDVDESKLPMTFDEYCRCNYGYPDCPDDEYDYNNELLWDYYNTEIDRDGHTVAEFKIMSEAFELRHNDFSFCTVNSYIIDKAGLEMDVQKMTVWKIDGEYEFNDN